MKILFIDKYFFIKGGAERYYFEFADILSNKGNEVIPFSMKHSNNLPSKFEQYFVNNIDYDGNFFKKILQFPQSFFRMIYSTQAKAKIKQLIEKTRPDLAHIHMIEHQISPSILHVIKDYGIPIIQTVHQYKLICPNYRLYNPRKKTICEKCIKGNYFHPIWEKCHKSSSIMSTMIAIEMAIHKKMKIYEKNIDLFHVPSSFMGNKLVEGGIDPQKIFKLYYTIDLDSFVFQKEFDNYIVYYGRLSEEKGILTLLKAMCRVSNTTLLIVGDGPQKRILMKFVEKNQLTNVSFLGYKNKNEIKKIIGKSKFVVVPSEWYDNSPLVIYEAFAMGKAVIGSNMGGIPELIDNELTGFVFKAGDEDDLSDKIRRLLNSNSLIYKYGKNARKKAENEFNSEYHYKVMMNKYNQLVSG